MTFKYEIGDEFRSDYGSWKQVKAANRTGAGTNEYWVIGKNGHARTFTECSMSNWTKIEPYFEIGDTFTSPWDSSATMTVTHLDGVVKSAWVTVTSEDDSPRKESVGEATWSRVKDEILKNRNV